MSHLKKALEKAKAERSIHFFGERLDVHKASDTQAISRIFDSLSDLDAVLENLRAENSIDSESSQSGGPVEFRELPREISYPLDVRLNDNFSSRHTGPEETPNSDAIDTNEVFCF